MIIVKFFCFEFYFAFWKISFYSCKNKLLKPVEICAYVQFNGVDTRTDTRCALLPSMCDFFFLKPGMNFIHVGKVKCRL